MNRYPYDKPDFDPGLRALLSYLRSTPEATEKSDDELAVESRIEDMPPPVQAFVHTAILHGCWLELGWYRLAGIVEVEPDQEIADGFKTAGWDPIQSIFIGSSAGGEEVVTVCWNTHDYALGRWCTFEGELLVDGDFGDFFWLAAEVEINDRNRALSDLDEDLELLLLKSGLYETFTETILDERET